MLPVYPVGPVMIPLGPVGPVMLTPLAPVGPVAPTPGPVGPVTLMTTSTPFTMRLPTMFTLPVSVLTLSEVVSKYDMLPIFSCGYPSSSCGSAVDHYIGHERIPKRVRYLVCAL